MQVYACFGVYDYFIPGDMIPSNQPDSAAFMKGMNNGEVEKK